MTKPPFDLGLIDRLTPLAIARGHRILQTHRYHAADLAHVTILLGTLDPPRGAWVLDAGCGIGEVSRLMSELRPDLRFILVNVSRAQLALCPQGDRFFTPMDGGDCHALQMTDETVEAVMFNCSLCQMDEAIALKEACRVLVPGGILMLNELVRVEGDPGPLEQALACRTLTVPALKAAVTAAGFTRIDVDKPPADLTTWRAMLAEDSLEALAEGVKPILLRAVKA